MILLDTHALIWWVNGDKQLTRKARSVIDDEIKRDDGVVLVSSISTWEIALLIRKERLSLTMEVDDWIATVAAIEGVRFVPVNNEIAIQAVRLPGELHRDPADRMIIATARFYAARLVTADTRIRAYRHIKTIW